MPSDLVQEKVRFIQQYTTNAVTVIKVSFSIVQRTISSAQ